MRGIHGSCPDSRDMDVIFLKFCNVSYDIASILHNMKSPRPRELIDQECDE
jgi:hypothetical protein